MKGMAIAGMVLGILSLVFLLPFLWPVAFIGIILAVVGLVLSIIARNKLATPEEGRGMATAGMVMSIIALALCVIVFVACVACAACIGTEYANQTGSSDLLGDLLNQIEVTQP